MSKPAAPKPKPKKRKVLEPIVVDVDNVPTLDDVPFDVPYISEDHFSHVLQAIGLQNTKNRGAKRFQALHDGAFFDVAKIRELVASLAAYYKKIHGKGLRVHEEIARNLGINIAVVVAMEYACREKYNAMLASTSSRAAATDTTPAVVLLVFFLFTSEKEDLQRCLRCDTIPVAPYVEILMALRNHSAMLAKWVGVGSVLLTTYCGDPKTWEMMVCGGLLGGETGGVVVPAPTVTTTTSVDDGSMVINSMMNSTVMSTPASPLHPHQDSPASSVPSSAFDQVSTPQQLYLRIVFPSRANMETYFTKAQSILLAPVLSLTMRSKPWILHAETVPTPASEQSLANTPTTANLEGTTPPPPTAPLVGTTTSGTETPPIQPLVLTTEEIELENRVAHVFITKPTNTEIRRVRWSYYTTEEEYLTHPLTLYACHVATPPSTKKDLQTVGTTLLQPYVVRLTSKVWPAPEVLFGMSPFLEAATQDVVRASAVSANLCQTLKGMWTQPYHCPRHKVERFSGYCNTDRCFVCNACVREGHGPHKETVQSIDMFCAMEKNRIAPKFQTVEQRLKKLAEVKAHIVPRREEMHLTIDHHLTNLIAALNARRAELHADIDRRTQEQLSAFTISKGDCDRDMAKLQGALDTLHAFSKRDVSLAPPGELGDFARGLTSLNHFVQNSTFRLHAPRQIVDRLSVHVATDEMKKQIRMWDWNSFTKHFPVKLYPPASTTGPGDGNNKK
eukprot:PhF_6_TR32160/c0_g1_i1/m.47704